MRQAKYDYEWLGYALLLTCSDGDERLIQGEEAGELYDELENIPSDAILQDAISNYFI